ncbi:MAG: Fe-S cluster assembly ATPase SufC [Patescibacteria group bacterium]|jgi:Fe-S cluster assembly ATP-binding protein
MLSVKNLTVIVGKTKVLKDVSLDVKPGQIHVLIGPNGSGKSSLAKTIIGFPDYKVIGERSKLTFNSTDLMTLSMQERARLGIFVSSQEPVVLEGVEVFPFLRQLHHLHQESPLPFLEFKNTLNKQIESLGLTSSFLNRSLNDEFSGGEKKRMELLQAMVVMPKVAVFDEIDSGLDRDGLQVAATTINNMVKNGMGCILITHQGKILEYVKPSKVHILINGAIVKSGGKSLLKVVEKKGYSSLAV